jgi:hypothetical protein
LRATKEDLESYVSEGPAGKGPVAAIEGMAGKSCAQREIEGKSHLDVLKRGARMLA